MVLPFFFFEGNGTAIWESFDHLTDTIIPDSLSSSDVAKRLVAWKGPDDPSSSNFVLHGWRLKLRSPDCHLEWDRAILAESRMGW